MTGTAGSAFSAEMRAMMAANSELTVEKVEGGGFKGWLQVQKGQSAQIFAVAGGLMVQINVNRDDGEAAKKYWAAVDLAGLAGAVKAK